jgi:hypothetical protein
MAEGEIKYRRGKYVIDQYEFLVGGEGDALIIDFVNDTLQGFGVPAKSLLLINHAGGAGENLIHYRTSEDGSGWEKTASILPDCNEEYAPADGQVISQMMIWASGPHVVFSMRATPGIWTLKELRQYIPSPAPTVERSLLGLTDKWSILETGV